jgi:hypothetical protein
MKYKCPCCPKKYQSINDLDNHIKKIHKLSPVALRYVPESERSEFVKKCLSILKEIKDKN